MHVASQLGEAQQPQTLHKDFTNLTKKRPLLYRMDITRRTRGLRGAWAAAVIACSSKRSEHDPLRRRGV